jgi:hypothetical protein
MQQPQEKNPIYRRPRRYAHSESTITIHDDEVLGLGPQVFDALNDLLIFLGDLSDEHTAALQFLEIKGMLKEFREDFYSPALEGVH